MKPSGLLLRNGHVLDQAFTDFSRSDVLIEGGQIAEIGTDIEVNESSCVSVIDAEGKYLIPGLVDFHVHTGVEYSDHLELFLRHGITLVRDVGSDLNEAARLRSEIRDASRLGPRIVSYGELVDGENPRWPEISVVPRDRNQLEEHIQRCRKRGLEGVKFYHKLQAELLYEGILLCHQNNLLTAGHLGDATSACSAVEHGMDSIEHVVTLTRDLVPVGAVREEDGFWHYFGPFEAWTKHVDINSERASKAIETFIVSGALLVPTLAIYEAIAYGDDERVLLSPDLSLVSDSLLQEWRNATDMRGFSRIHYSVARHGLERMKAFVERFHSAGGRLAVGTDTPNPFVVPGTSLYREIALLHDIGMSRSEVLRACCYLPAEHLGESEDWGEICEGKQANVVILNRNPLVDLGALREVSMVIKNGIPLRSEAVRG